MNYCLSKKGNTKLLFDKTFAAATKKRSTAVVKRGVDFLFNAPLAKEAIARWLKDAPKRLQAEEKKIHKEAKNDLFEETEEVVNEIDKV